MSKTVEIGSGETIITAGGGWVAFDPNSDTDESKAIRVVDIVAVSTLAKWTTIKFRIAGVEPVVFQSITVPAAFADVMRAIREAS